MKLLLTLVGKTLAAQSLVMLVIGPLGYAMNAGRGLRWAVAGAAVWTLLFALAAIWLNRSVIGLGVAGGLVCGAAWAFGGAAFESIVLLAPGPFGFVWAALLGALGGIGAGLMGGAVEQVVGEPSFRRVTRLGAWAAAIAWGALSGATPYFRDGMGAGIPAWSWAIAGALLGSAAMPAGWSLGRGVSPVIAVFDEISPYLVEMTRPLAAFAAGFLTLTVVFAGFYGTLWRIEPASAFQHLPDTPGIWDFVEFSLMTATTANTPVVATSPLARLLVGVEVVLGTGWLIVVFGALSVHLAPRLEEIAARVTRRSPRGQ